MARTCPKCGLGVADEAVTCGHCDSLLPSNFVATPLSGPSRPPVSGRWEVLEALEGHGSARAYVARNQSTSETACLRMLPVTLAEDDKARERILEALGREKALAGTPGIAAIVGFEVEDRNAYFVTEPFRGRTLQDLAKKHKGLSPEEALRIGAAAAEALAAAHGKGIPHGEVRPSSILVEEGPDGEVRVTDFALAKIVSEHSAAQMGGGPSKATFYRSPEFVRTDLPDVRSDLYALGCVLYEVVVGERRFPDAYNEACREPRAGALFPDPFEGKPVTHDRFRAVVRRLVAPDAADRFEDGTAAAAAMRGGEFAPAKVLTGASAAARGPALGTMREKASRPLPWGVFAVVVLGLGGLGYAASVFLAGGPEEGGGVGGGEEPPPPPVFVPAAPVLTDLPPPPETALGGLVLPEKFVLRDGRIWSQVDGAEMVLIPGGAFPMGSADGAADTRPQRTVTVSPFLIDRHEVTVAQFRRFCDSSGRRLPPQPEGGTTRHPVVNVSWSEANAFAAWAAKRLPTEAEWEKAARGTGGNPFPWGGEDEPARRNGPGAEDGHEGAAVPGSFPEGASPFGCLDMIGNVWEWCGDVYAADAYATGPAKDPAGPPSGGDRVVRGGSFLLGGPPLRATFRNRAEPSFRYEDIGFRCAASVK